MTLRQLILHSIAACAAFTPCYSEVPEGTTDADKDGQLSLTEFESYAGERLSSFSKAQLAELAKRVDENADGTIDAKEFAGRISKVRAVIAWSPAEDDPATDKETDAIQALPLSPANADVLLITSQSLHDAWSTFASWKSRTGKETKVVTVPQIRSHYEAENVQEKIRLCVREHI